MNEIIKHYSNGEVTVVWQPKFCIHSTNCFHGLPEVFMPSKRPWVDANGASTEEIIKQIKKCPSGALSYFMDSEKQEQKMENEKTQQVVTVEPLVNGPLMVTGTLTIKTDTGEEIKGPATYFCRCGGSGNKPYCDGTHNVNGFQG